MSARTHSEGPWSAARANGHLRVNDRFGMLICKVAQTRRNAAADLRLLAAAPDLLTLADAFEAYLLGDGCADENELVVECRAAIAKAGGRREPLPEGRPGPGGGGAGGPAAGHATAGAASGAPRPRRTPGGRLASARYRRCECGALATRFNRKLAAHVCAICEARDSLRLPVKERSSAVVRLAARLGEVTAEDVATAVAITPHHAHSVLSRLARQGLLRRRAMGEYEVAA